MYVNVVLCLFAYSTVAYWSYNDQTSWQGQCNTGHLQSPIPMPQPNVMPIRGDVEMHYEPVPLKIVDTGHVLKISLENSGFITVPNVNTKYNLKEMNFHTRSEHWIGQMQYDMELHLIHQDSAGNYLNIAVLCDFDDRPTTHWLDEFIGPFLDLQGLTGDGHVHTVEPPSSQGYIVDVAEFWDMAMRGLETYYNYVGSIPEPPCSEDVQWIVSGHICLASRQWEAVMTNFKTCQGNYRSLQPDNGRTIELSTTSDSFLSEGRSGGSSTKDNGSGMSMFIPLLILLCCIAACLGAYLFNQKESKKDPLEYQRHEDVPMDYESQKYNNSQNGKGPFHDNGGFRGETSRYGENADADDEKVHEYVYEPHASMGPSMAGGVE